jgi:hypothetical protein
MSTDRRNEDVCTCGHLRAAHKPQCIGKTAWVTPKPVGYEIDDLEPCTCTKYTEANR